MPVLRQSNFVGMLCRRPAGPPALLPHATALVPAARPGRAGELADEVATWMTTMTHSAARNAGAAWAGRLGTQPAPAAGRGFWARGGGGHGRLAALRSMFDVFSTFIDNRLSS